MSFLHAKNRKSIHGNRSIFGKAVRYSFWIAFKSERKSTFLLAKQTDFVSLLINLNVPPLYVLYWYDEIDDLHFPQAEHPLQIGREPHTKHDSQKAG